MYDIDDLKEENVFANLPMIDSMKHSQAEGQKHYRDEEQYHF